MRYLFCLAVLFSYSLCNAQGINVWNIGVHDNSSAELALGPSDYKKFLANDFGYEDRYYLIGQSNPKKDFPYVIPGPSDAWGGTWATSGWRTHDVNILFGVEEIAPNTQFKLIVDLLDSHPKKSLFKVIINDKQSEKFLLKGQSDSTLVGKTPGIKSRTIEIPIDKNVIREGGNAITLTVLEGSWVVFDDVRLEATLPVKLEQPDKVFLRDVYACRYEIEKDGKRFQPLLVDVEHLQGRPKLSVELDGKTLFTANVDTTRYQFEVPMPAVATAKNSAYTILIDGKPVSKGTVQRAPQQLQSYADYVDTKIGTAHSRWMIAPGPWMPFSMVKMSPDNQNRGWQAGYQPSFETVGCFSHIHEWTMGGLGLMPTNGTLQTKVGDQFDPDAGYRSRIDKMSEEAPLGYYKVYMTDTHIQAEVTATTRCGFQRYTFPNDKDGRVMIDLHVEAEYDYKLLDVKVDKVSDYRIEGYSHQISPRPHVWSNDADQEYTIYFVIEFDRPIKNVGGWIDDQIIQKAGIQAKDIKDAGMYVEFDTRNAPVVQVRSGISLVSLGNASENLSTEITEPFGWNFGKVVDNQKNVWNDIFSRLAITTDNRLEKLRFYTNMYRALCRNTWSDVNGEWISAGGVKQKFANPDHVALGCDAFWNTFWNLNQFWNLVTPEWSSRWVHSQLAMYDADGWLAKGPAGMKYIPVMVAEHEIPLIVSAYQMGIRDFDADKALKAMVKMQTTPAIHVASGFAGNRDLVHYMKYKYVPSDLGRFSNTLEYAYDDWTVGQFAKSLGKNKEYKQFADRGNWWKNAINPENGYAHMRDSSGQFVPDFNPFRSGANQQYVEGNAWQLSYFVPQDVPGLANILGEKAFVERLDWGFTASEPWRYNAPNDQYWDYPVVQGNQQSMHFAFLFNWVNHPWLTQRWSRSIIDGYYGSGLANAYLGDEDQGQMSAWLVMASLGLFQTDGGCNASPVYEIASPLYEKVVIDLGKRYGRGEQFVIEAKGASKINKYVQSAVLNGKELKTFWFPASELLKGGSLVLIMGDQPNHLWGIGLPDTNRK
ncbi:GH92 family glycosyl hydrolase [Bacteroidales bacterium OttesenSCG-928-A17]|nr:GH92 family glycosyl hydrolase [Bacteroidales bacterium OttesenSCG-928-A17]